MISELIMLIEVLDAEIYFGYYKYLSSLDVYIYFLWMFRSFFFGCLDLFSLDVWINFGCIDLSTLAVKLFRLIIFQSYYPDC